MPKQRKKLLLVDGYNVLRSGSRYQRIAGPDYTDDTFNTAREALINDVVNYAGRDWRAVIVFDGAKNRFSTGEAETVGGVRIVFSPAGQSGRQGQSRNWRTMPPASARWRRWWSPAMPPSRTRCSAMASTA